MKNIAKIALLFLIFAMTHCKMCLAQDSFFPLAIGNCWYYISLPDYYSIAVVDTVRINDIQYFLLDWWGMRYFRVDSAQRLIEYKNGKGQILLDFRMEKGDTIHNYEKGFTACDAKDTVTTFIGTKGVEVRFHTNRDTTMSEQEWIVTFQQGVGIVEENYPSLGRGNLVGLVLDGNKYGQVSIERGFSDKTEKNYILENNYPNPFNSSTIISYSIRKPGLIKLRIVNPLGVEVALLENEFKLEGHYNRVWHPGESIASGIYFIQIFNSQQVEFQKVLYLK